MMNGNVPNKKPCVKKSMQIRFKIQDFGEKKWFLEFLILFHLIYFIQVILFGAIYKILHGQPGELDQS